jgi:hypothetical protein
VDILEVIRLWVLRLLMAFTIARPLPVDIDDVLVLELHPVTKVEAGDGERVVPQLTDDVALLNGDDLDPHAFAPVASTP